MSLIVRKGSDPFTKSPIGTEIRHYFRELEPGHKKSTQRFSDTNRYSAMLSALICQAVRFLHFSAIFVIFAAFNSCIEMRVYLLDNIEMEFFADILGFLFVSLFVWKL